VVEDICCVGVIIQFVFFSLLVFHICYNSAVRCVGRLHGLVRERPDQKMGRKKEILPLLLGIDYISLLFELEFLFIFRIREFYLDQDFYCFNIYEPDPICFEFGLRIALDKSYSNSYEHELYI
jgi:hypothetical protein